MASSSGQPTDLPPLPVNDQHWQAIAAALGLPKRHARIVELVLRDVPNPQIASEFDIEESTVRTYLDRIWTRTGTRGRMPLAMKIWAVSLELVDRSDVLRSDDNGSDDG